VICSANAAPLYMQPACYASCWPPLPSTIRVLDRPDEISSVRGSQWRTVETLVLVATHGAQETAAREASTLPR
jgi:hypothetical protein